LDLLLSEGGSGELDDHHEGEVEVAQRVHYLILLLQKNQALLHPELKQNPWGVDDPLVECPEVGPQTIQPLDQLHFHG
jgi:hypothetical protein